MHKWLIARWNERVKVEDTVYIIGDSYFHIGEKKGLQYYLDQLNGNKVVLSGNHDERNKAKTIIHSCVIELGGFNMYLTHRPEDADLNYCVNLVGHVHKKWKVMDVEGSTLVNVGVDVWNYQPVSFNEIMALVYEYKRRKENNE